MNEALAPIALAFPLAPMIMAFPLMAEGLGFSSPWSRRRPEAGLSPSPDRVLADQIRRKGDALAPTLRPGPEGTTH